MKKFDELDNRIDKISNSESYQSPTKLSKNKKFDVHNIKVDIMQELGIIEEVDLN